MSNYLIPHQIRVQLVRDSDSNPPSPVIKDSDDVRKLLWSYFATLDREAFVSVMLNSAGRLLGVEIVTLGILNASLVHPREVFKSAILSNANAIIICHNHPSGELTPSAEDLRITRQLISSGELLGIKILDHLIFAADQTRSIINH